MLDGYVMTVRFTYRNELIRIIGAGYWRKGKKYMKAKKYTNEPIGRLKIVNDFLPKPQDLILKEDTIKVTLMLSRKSINYFKQEAGKHYAHYQAMIRALLDNYVQRFEIDSKIN